MIHEQGLDFEITAYISTQQEGETVFHGLVTGHCILFCCNVGPLWHLFPKKPRLIAVKDLLRQITLGNHELLELGSERLNCLSVRTRSLSMPQNTMDATSPLKVIKPSPAHLAAFFVFC